MNQRMLPPVPPRAPVTPRWSARALSLIFVATLVLPGLSVIKTASRTTLTFEYRAATAWPAPAFTRQFTSDFERAFGDRFGGRPLLLLIHHATMVDVFNVSPAPLVLLGKDNWLYFLGEDTQSLDRHYRGTLPIADALLDALVNEYKRRARFLAEHGIPYVVVIVPEKFTIYPEHLPDWASRRMPRTPLDRTLDRMQADGSVRFVDLRSLLRNAKGDRPLYYMSDSHWNLNGATIGYDAIMREVQRALPFGRLASIAPPARPSYVPGVDVYRGDLARMTGFRPRFDEPDYFPLSKVQGDQSSRCAKRVDNGADSGIEFYSCNRADLPRAVIYRDSMAISLIPLLSENFGRVVYVESRRLDPALILREKPDIVIDEMVERAMFGVVATPMP